MRKIVTAAVLGAAVLGAAGCGGAAAAQTPAPASTPQAPSASCDVGWQTLSQNPHFSYTKPKSSRWSNSWTGESGGIEPYREALVTVMSGGQALSGVSLTLVYYDQANRELGSDGFNESTLITPGQTMYWTADVNQVPQGAAYCEAVSAAS
jgi:hypothetical protein